MSHVAFDNEVVSVEDRFKERQRLAKVFIDEFGDSVIVHSVNDSNDFKSILIDACLKLPLDHSLDKKTSLMERMLGFDNCIYFSAGFVYATSFNWKFNLIFSVDFVKDLTYYSHSINYQSYVKIVQYWYSIDKEYFNKLLGFNSLSNEVITKHFDGFSGLKTNALDFWKIEEVLDTFIKEYSDQEAIQKIFSDRKKELFMDFAVAKKDANFIHFEERAPEILSFKEVNLLNNKYFLGFYVKGVVPEDILLLLKEKFEGKFLFDGDSFQKL